jgi:hypothetical protein
MRAKKNLGGREQDRSSSAFARIPQSLTLLRDDRWGISLGATRRPGAACPTSHGTLDLNRPSGTMGQSRGTPLAGG